MPYPNPPASNKSIIRSLDKIAHTEHGGNDDEQDYSIVEIAGKNQRGYQLVCNGKKRHVKQVDTV